MLVVVLCVLVVLASMVVLALAGLTLWRSTKRLASTVGAAGEQVATASAGLEQGLGELQRATPAAPQASSARRGDGPALAARVERRRSG